MVAKSHPGGMSSLLRSPETSKNGISRSRSHNSSFSKAGCDKDTTGVDKEMSFRSPVSRRKKIRELKQNSCSSLSLTPKSPNSPYSSKSPLSSLTKKEKLRLMKNSLKFKSADPSSVLKRVQKKIDKGDSIDELQQKIRLMELKIDSIRDETEEKVSKIQKKAKKDRKEVIKTLAEQKEAKKTHEKSLRKLQKAQPMIDAIKKQNALIRDQNKRLSIDIRNLKVNNERLQGATMGNSDTVLPLQEYYNRVKTDNMKLQKMHDELKLKVKEVKNDLKEKNTQAEVIHNIKCAYGNTILSIEELLKLKQVNKDLEEYVSEIVRDMEIDRKELVPTGMYSSSPFLHFQKSAETLGSFGFSSQDFNFDLESDDEDEMDEK